MDGMDELTSLNCHDEAEGKYGLSSFVFKLDRPETRAYIVRSYAPQSSADRRRWKLEWNQSTGPESDHSSGFLRKGCSRLSLAIEFPGK